jgi:thiamine pyrophosphate-dependent acetolactate synthase large subunit-like protein
MMTQREALEVVAAVRGEQVVVTTMGSTGIWPAISDTPLDFNYIPSSMGQGIALGLGLALAQPQRGIIAVMGDGSLLMNLGALVTVANHPARLHVVVLDNGLYEITGGQAVAGAGRTDFAGLARAAGIPNVFAYDSIDRWKAESAAAMNSAGPSFVWLKVQGQLGQKTPAPPRPMAAQIARLQEVLAVTS